MAEAKGINPELTAEVVEEVKEATAEVVEKAPFLASWERIRPIVLFYALYVMAAALLLALHLMVL
jgi:predicted GNAT family acetyltransferase